MPVATLKEKLIEAITERKLLDKKEEEIKNSY